MALTFYFAPRSSSSRISWVLEELGVPYEKVHVDIRNGGGKAADFLQGLCAWLARPAYARIQ